MFCTLARPHAAWIVLLLAGCGGSEKQLPTDVATPADGKPDESAIAVPAKSDPEAAKFVEQRIAAATAGHPDRLEKLKAMRQKANGRWTWELGQISTVTRDVLAVWPERMNIDLDFASGQIKGFRMELRQNTVRAFTSDGSGFQPFEPPNPREYDETAAVDAIAEQWLPIFVPLVDPKTIIYAYKKQVLGGQMADTVMLALPRCPPFTLWFDATNGNLGIISYSHTEFGQKYNKQVMLDAPKPYDGVLLPTRLESRRNGTSVQEWTVTRWDFPEKIADSEFERKK